MSYTVFKNTNNNIITAPNESGEIILDTSISKQIRIEVNRNTYRFYDIAEKKYLKASEIGSINLERCFFTAIIYPCGKTLNPALVDNEENYPILYKFVYSCLGSTFSDYPIASFNMIYCSNNIYSTKNSSIAIEFKFHSGFNDVKIRLNLSPSGSTTTEFSLTSDDVEILSLFQHNITIEGSYVTSMGSSNTKYIYSLSFSFINNRYEQYDKSGLTTKNQVLSMIEDLSQGKKYPASGLMYNGTYSNTESSMSINVYTIEYIYSIGSGLIVNSLFTGKKSGLKSATTVDSISTTISPSIMNTLSFADDVITLS